jgi:prevent-host-death family protein
MATKRIGAAQFKEKCLSLLDEVEPEGIIVTKHGVPVAKLVPIHAESVDLIGSLKGKIKIRGDILSTGVDWDAQS